MSSVIWFLFLMFSFSVLFAQHTEDGPTGSQLVFERKFDLTKVTPEPFYENQQGIIHYRAYGAYEFSVLITNKKTKKSVHYDQLKKSEGDVVINPYELQPGEYIYALIINNRMVMKKKLTVRPYQ